MNILVIQENGRHEKNRHFRECYSLQRAFIKLGHSCDVWGLGHINYKSFLKSYDVIINLENYDEQGWVPDLSKINSKKYLWSIDAHVRGLAPYKQEFHRGSYTKILQSTLQLVDEDSVWFPNAYDDTLIKPLNIDKKYNIGFCGNINNRGHLIQLLENKFNLKKDVFVIGDDMVSAINSYKIHFNCNINIDINYRSFETIGCKTALITNYNPAYEKLGFHHGKNCMMYSNPQELLNYTEELLHNQDLLKQISENGYKLAENHTYYKRAEYFIKEILK